MKKISKTTKQSHQSSPLAQKLVKFVDQTDISTIEEYVSLSSTKQVLKLLAEYLDSKLDSNISNSEKKGRFDDPNWSLSHADDIGYRRGLRELKSLIGGDHA
jgi:hypothetical protein